MVLKPAILTVILRVDCGLPDQVITIIQPVLHHFLRPWRFTYLPHHAPRCNFAFRR